MIDGTNTTALSSGPSLLGYVSVILNLTMIGVPLEIPLDTTGRDDDIEHRMTYWREDPGVNLYHMHWHMVHPFTAKFPVSITQNRRGELFYYLHQQILARYNVERLCNGLSLVNPLAYWDEPIPEPYYPTLNSYVASKNYPTRTANMKLINANRTDLDIEIDIKVLKLYKKRIFKAIYRKKVLADNDTYISIDNDQGIDILGNIVEASNLSPNEDYYGSIHNAGHALMAVVHDPDGKLNQTTGVMFRPNTAMRDPLFYTWHTFLNDFFEQHKSSLRAYDKKDLSFPGVQVTNVKLISYQSGKYMKEKNTLYTYTTKSDVNMTKGLDFISKVPVFVRVTQQNHDEFDYIIECVNNFREQLLGTVRIFFLPILGFHDSPMKLSEQRHYAIEMDKFVQPLKPGINKIVRRSTMSSVTIPFEQTFRDLNEDSRAKNEKEYERFIFCGCGWPQHLLVPRGTVQGYPLLLFAMITDASKDRVDPDRDINPNPSKCKQSESMCGLIGRKYPDKRPAGFPFDRPASNNVDTIEAFLTPNMAIKPITIFHLNEVRQGRLLSNATPVTFKSVELN